MKKRFIVALAAVVVSVWVGVYAPSSFADATPVPEIVEAMQRVPGGIAIDSRTAYWPDEGMTMEVPDALRRDAIGPCPKGSVCAFSVTNLGGIRLSWTTCGTHSTTALTAVRSIANAKTSGTLQARYGTTVRATAPAQSWNNVTGTVNNVHC